MFVLTLYGIPIIGLEPKLLFMSEIYFEKSGVMLPVVAVECKYRIPAKLGDKLRVVSYIDSVPMAKMRIRSEIFNQKDQLLCEGSVTLGFIDAQTRRPMRCPEFLLAALENKL